MKANTAYDRIVPYEGSLLQHGPLNDRVYVMKIEPESTTELLDYVDKLVEEHDYSKVFAKAPDNCIRTFKERGYEKEAFIPDFYGDKTGCAFMSLFLSSKRRTRSKYGTGIVAENTGSSPEPANLPPGFSIEKCTMDNLEEMAEIYSRIFATYPFPIQDPAYLKKTMMSHVDYFAVRHQNRIIALSSAEMDPDLKTVEMTDFAVLPESRGHSLARILLNEMENEMQKLNMRVAYTIARAKSPGINRSFSYSDYEFSGTLIKNTSICGELEDMNVWHKEL